MSRSKQNKTLQNLACHLFRLGGFDLDDGLQRLEMQVGRLARSISNGNVADIATRLDTICHQLEALPNSIQAAHPANASSTIIPEPLPTPNNPTDTARKLMKIHDTLWLAQHQSGALPANGVNRMIQDIGELLQDEGIEVFNDCGVFDPIRHTIMDIAPAELTEQNEHIQQTIRPGYRWQAKTLRPQEVILYQYQAKDS